MPVGEWPLIDRERWHTGLREGDFLDGGPRARLRSITNSKVEKGYGRFLTFLLHRDAEAIDVVEDQTSPKVVLDYVEQLRTFGNSKATLLSRLQELHDALGVIYPEHDWTFIRTVSARIRRTAQSHNGKRARMVSADDLFALDVRLMTASKLQATPRLAAIMFRDGLVVAFLALRPIRLKNLAELMIGTTLVRAGDNCRVVLTGAQVKNGAPLEFEWPKALNSKLCQWLATHRPVLIKLRSRWARPIANALWVSSHGSPMTKQALYDRIAEVTRMGFGNSINPHLFRDIAATTLAIYDPDHVTIAAPLFGHRSFATTEKYYEQANTIEATCRYQKQVRTRRRAAVARGRAGL